MIGIYKITCIKNNKVYIGSSNNINRRKIRHFSELRNNKHYNEHLQRSFNKYGEQNFYFDVLEECECEELFNKEMYYINEYNALNYKHGYNISEEASSPTLSGEKHYLYQQYGNKNPKSKAVIQLDENYNVVARYESVNLCMRLTGIDASTISKVCRGEKHTFKGCIWKYEEDFNEIDIDKIEKVKPFKSKVVQLSLDGEFINEYESINEAGRMNNINYKNIQTVCKGKRNNAGGYKWVYENEYKNQAL